MFYVNGKLKHIIDDFDEIARRLNDNNNLNKSGFLFSLGLVPQGLLESQTFDGIDEMDRGLPIEENFGYFYWWFIRI
jgi:hypothetical protein